MRNKKATFYESSAGHAILDSGLHPGDLNDFVQTGSKYLFTNIKHCKRVMDFGCGHGDHLSMLARLPCMSVFGLDYSMSMALEAVANLDEHSFTGSRVILTDASDAAIQRHTMDACYCMMNTLGNFPDKIKVIQEMERVTVPGGILLFTVFSEHAVNAQIELYRNIAEKLSISCPEEDFAQVTDTYVLTSIGLRSERFTQDRLTSIFSSALGKNQKVDVQRICKIGYGVYVRL